MIQLWVVHCEISKSNFDQSDVIRCRNPYTSVKLQDNLMPCVLKWSKCLYFCVIWKDLISGIMARGRNTFSPVVNCVLKIWKTESSQKWQGHASQVGFICKLCLPQQFVITCGCFIAGHIQFKVELYKATLPVPFPPFLPHLKERGKRLAWFVLRPKRKEKNCLWASGFLSWRWGFQVTSGEAMVPGQETVGHCNKWDIAC